MFNAVERNDIGQISLTGARAIMFIGLLIVEPRTLEEVRQVFLDLNIIEEKNSYDILRIDLNTIKAMGCKISRATAKNGYKYILSRHPFELNIASDELKVLKKVYEKVKEKINLQQLIGFDNLFKKLASYIFDEEIKEELLGISILKYHDVQLIDDLNNDCKQTRILDLIYRKPGSTKDERKEIIAQDLVFKNDKIYLYGHDTKKNEAVTLNFQRIKNILGRKPSITEFNAKPTKIKFILKDLNKNLLNDNEKIINSSDNNITVEAEYHNEFVAVQRVMELGPKCIVTAPTDFRNNIIQKLKEMSNLYEE